jgi:hypothetical protein
MADYSFPPQKALTSYFFVFRFFLAWDGPEASALDPPALFVELVDGPAMSSSMSSS